MFHGFKFQDTTLQYWATENSLAKDVYQAQAPRAPTPYDPPTLEKKPENEKKTNFSDEFC